MTTDIGRNDPCPCGSGKKYKKCHLEKDETTNRKEREKAALNAAKVMADQAKQDEKEGKDPKSTAPHAHGDDKKSWMSKVAGRVGFFKTATQRRAPSANKGG